MNKTINILKGSGHIIEKLKKPSPKLSFQDLSRAATQVTDPVWLPKM